MFIFSFSIECYFFDFKIQIFAVSLSTNKYQPDVIALQYLSV